MVKIGNTRCMFPVEVKQGDVLSSCFSSHTINKCPFYGFFSVTFFTGLCFLWVISLFKMALKCPATVLSSFFLGVKRAARCLMEKTCVLDKFRSGMNYSAVGHKCNVNGSTGYILKDIFKQKHT